MSDRYEIDGIIYFKEPYRADYSTWLAQHLDCDTIISEFDFDNSIVCVICYASSSNFNDDLRAIKMKKYPNYRILQGFSSEEVLSLC